MSAAHHDHNCHDDAHGQGDAHDALAPARGPDPYIVYPTSEDLRKSDSTGMAYLAFFVILGGLLLLIKAFA